MPTLLPKSLKTKLGGRGSSPQQAWGTSPQLNVSFKDGTHPKGDEQALAKPSQEELDAELRGSPACRRMSSAEKEPGQEAGVYAGGQKPTVDSVFARLDNASPETLQAALGPAALDMHRPPELEGVGSSTASSRRPSGPTTPGAAQPKKSRPRIDEWAAVDGGACPFQAPEMRPIKLTGIVSNHPVLKDGPISTSLIQRLDEARGLAWTISTEYALGKPSAKFEAEMARYGAPRPLMYSSDSVTRIAEQTSVLRQDPHRWGGAARPVAAQAAEPEPKYEPSPDVSIGSSGGITVLAGKEEGAAGKGPGKQAVAGKDEPGEAAGGAAGEAARGAAGEAAGGAAGEAAASDAAASGRQARASLATQGPE